MSTSTPPKFYSMAEQPTQEDIRRNMDRIIEDFKSMTAELVKINQGREEWMASFPSVMPIIPEYRFKNAMTKNPEELVHYPEDIVVVPPLPRTLQDAKDISGEDAEKALILLYDPCPVYNMPADTEGRRERLWAYLELFGRRLF